MIFEIDAGTGATLAYHEPRVVAAADWLSNRDSVVLVVSATVILTATLPPSAVQSRGTDVERRCDR